MNEEKLTTNGMLSKAALTLDVGQVVAWIGFRHQQGLNVARRLQGLVDEPVDHVARKGKTVAAGTVQPRGAPASEAHGIGITAGQ
jgi:hypothetical protein